MLSAELDLRHQADDDFRSRSHDGCAFEMATDHAAVSSTHCAVQVVLPVGAQSSGERDDLQLLNIRIDLCAHTKAAQAKTRQQFETMTPRAGLLWRSITSSAPAIRNATFESDPTQDMTVAALMV